MSDRPHYYGVYLQVLHSDEQKRLQAMVFPHVSPERGLVRSWSRLQNWPGHRASWTLRNADVADIASRFDRALSSSNDAALKIVTIKLTAQGIQDVWSESKTPYVMIREFQRAARVRGLFITKI